MTILLLMQLLSDIGLAAFAIIMLFVEYANYLIDRHKRHWMAMAICLVFAMIFVVRAFDDVDLIAEKSAQVALAILWFINLMLCVVWGGMILIAKWKYALRAKRFIRENQDGVN